MARSLHTTNSSRQGRNGLKVPQALRYCYMMVAVMSVFRIVKDQTIASYMGPIDTTEAIDSTAGHDVVEKTICPPADPLIDKKYFGFPQNLTFGRFHGEKGRPFVTQDMWADMVDNKRTFMIRPLEYGVQSPELLRDWIRSRPHPITLVINNQQDKSWPDDLNNLTQYKMILNEPNILHVFAGNTRNLTQFPKLKPLPIGNKWAFKKTGMFAEPKNELAEKYRTHGASSPMETEQLFLSTNRTLSVYFRPMALGSNGSSRNYVRDTLALKMVRRDIPQILKQTAKESMVFAKGRVGPDLLFEQLKTHRFVVSPPGNGLDSHATWEALLCGCIPIVPRSDIDPLFEDLPVWLVDSWDEVTVEAVKEKDQYFKGLKYNWEKVYRQFWEKEIYKGLCDVREESHV